MSVLEKLRNEDFKRKMAEIRKKTNRTMISEIKNKLEENAREYEHNC